MKIVFFGTSNRSVPILESLNSNFDLVLCITKKDRRIGRKQEIIECGVKTWAKQNSVSYIEIDSLGEGNLENVLKALNKTKPEYGIVADFSFIIPQEMIDFFDKKLINIHFSLLPKFRGASPVQHAILEGEKLTGITYYIIDKKLDHGPILGQVGYNLTGNETSGEIYETLFKIAGEKLPEILEKYSQGSTTPLPQDEERATYTYSKSHPKNTHIYKEDARIDWKNTSENIDRQVRAYNPWPISWTYLKDLEKAKNLTEEKMKFKSHIDKGLKIKIYKTELEENKLKILDVQIEGKNKMNWESLKNGYLA